MKSIKARPVTTASTDPVWCHRCSIRIAPYDTRTVHNGKIYHRACYAKLAHGKAQRKR